MQNMEDLNILFIADLHAITVSYEPNKLRENVRSLAAIYLACGLDPLKTVLFIQSEVKAHSELSYLLQSITYIGELERMTQFKDKKVKQTQGVTTALLTYPVLMAADIMLYGTKGTEIYVPVGDDQKQHLELCRDLVERFNNRYGETFSMPKPMIRQNGSRIMALQTPDTKMSKSDPNTKSTIFLLDPPQVIRKKIMSAVTDSDNTIKFDPEKPGISNLLTILSCATETPIPELEETLQGKSYGEFKGIVAEAVINLLTPIQEKYQTILGEQRLDDILYEGAKHASLLSDMTVRMVKDRMGLTRNAPTEALIEED